MRRTSRTEFRDSRRASVEARQAMLERVGLRKSGHDATAPDFAEVAAALTQAGPAIEQMATAMGQTVDSITDSLRSVMSAPRLDPLTSIQQAAERIRQLDSYGLTQVIQQTYFRQRWVTGIDQPDDGLSYDAYRGGQRASVQAMYDPITWPDEGYPCQLCWAVKRWPWEPARSCPITVDVESTYCEKHGGQATTEVRETRPCELQPEGYGAVIASSVVHLR